MITVECDRTGCGASVEIGAEDGDWSPGSVMDQSEGYGDPVLVLLPEGWKVDMASLDSVIHCPDHAHEEVN